MEAAAAAAEAERKPGSEAVRGHRGVHHATTGFTEALVDQEHSELRRPGSTGVDLAAATRLACGTCSSSAGICVTVLNGVADTTEKVLAAWASYTRNFL